MAPVFQIEFGESQEDEESPETAWQQLRRCIIAALLGALFVSTVGRELWPLPKKAVHDLVVPGEHVGRAR